MAKAAVKDEVEARAIAEKCLAFIIDKETGEETDERCNESAAPCDGGSRGLCKTHYGQFDAARREVSDRAEFEAKKIRQGKLLPDSQGRSRKHKNQFRDE